MSEPRAVFLPQLNPNELEVRLVDLPIQAGQPVSAGDTLAVLETTKSTSTLLAESSGYIIGLRFKAGESAQSGEVLCYLADEPGTLISGESPAKKARIDPAGQVGLPAGLRITQPALALARQNGLDLARLPLGSLVTASQVEALLASLPSHLAIDAFSSLPDHFPPTSLIIYGGGGHGKSLIELVRSLGTYHLVGIIDDGLPPGSLILDLPILGGSAALKPLAERGLSLAINAVGGIGNLAPRLKVFDLLAQSGFTCPAIVHPAAFVEASASLSAGVQVFPQAYVGSSCQLGFGVIANIGVIISHDCCLADFVNVSPGAMLAGGVTVGERSLIGMGVTVNLGVSIGEGARIGNGATIKADVPAGKVIHAGSIWPL